MKKKLMVFASGSGSNAEKIFEYFTQNKTIEVVGLIYNREGAGVVEKANKFSIPTFYLSNDAFVSGDKVLEICKNQGAQFIILAGFLRKIPQIIIQAYSNNIINIHPALLPKYGGKGMYGHFVHEKVSENGDDISGMTIHLVDEVYDNGKILAQYTCPIIPHESADSIAQKVLQLEHTYFAQTIDKYISQL
ncbi:MAG: phosphoribosylglycinamide formyltransferase [Crocinitomicaceae bacterium]